MLPTRSIAKTDEALKNRKFCDSVNEFFFRGMHFGVAGYATHVASCMHVSKIVEKSAVNLKKQP